jgi:putative transport protein
MFGSPPLSQTQPIAHAIGVLAFVAAAGLALGSIKYRGIALGTAGVLFAGIVVGHFGERIDARILEFVKEFGLVLFVFTIGLQLGPGFIAALRQQGLQLNLLSAATVVLCMVVTALCAKVLGVDSAAALGLLSGATTNTPSLGAAQQTLATLPGVTADRAALPTIAYAVAYPAGTAGIIGSMLVLRALFRIDAVREAENFRAQQQAGIEPLERLNLAVDNRGLEGVSLGSLPGRRETGVVVSRIRAAASPEVSIATDASVLHMGDILLAVGTRRGLEQLTRIVGRVSEEDLMRAKGPLTTRRVVVTRKDVLGKTIGGIGFEQLYGVTVTRVRRAGLEMSATPELRLRFGDVIQVVGDPAHIDQAGAAMGNSLKMLDETQFIPLFVGLLLGVLIGVMPVPLPGMPVPLRLGLAGGPLIMGIALSRLGHLGRLVWHVPLNANIAFRELGITLFLAAVGLKAGEKFFATVFTRTGLLWLCCALAITMIPLVLVGTFARRVLKLNYTTLTGWIAGTNTDPPALAFAGLLAKSEGPYVAYATVYPFTMLMRILSAQALALFLFR